MPNSFPFYDAEPYWPAGGYGNGGGGGGTALLTDFWLWNTAAGNLTVPSKVSYVSGFSNGSPILTDLRFDAVTKIENDTTVYGVHVYDCPVGAILKLECDNISDCACNLRYLPNGESDQIEQGIEYSNNVCPMPIDGYVISGFYYPAIA